MEPTDSVMDTTGADLQCVCDGDDDREGHTAVMEFTHREGIVLTDGMVGE